jgi:hypothetical protein
MHIQVCPLYRKNIRRDLHVAFLKLHYSFDSLLTLVSTIKPVVLRDNEINAISPALLSNLWLKMTSL